MSISDQLTRRITQIDAWIVQVLDIMLMVQMANKENKKQHQESGRPSTYKKLKTPI